MSEQPAQECRGELSDDDVGIFLELSTELFGAYQPGEGLRWWNRAYGQLPGLPDVPDAGTGPDERILHWSPAYDRDTGLVYGAARGRAAHHADEEMLWSYQQVLQAVADHSTAAIFAKDITGQYVLVNGALAGLMGLRVDDMLGRTAAELWPERAASGQARDERIMTAGRSEMSDDVVELADGPHTVLITRFPLRNVDGEIVGMGGIASDITDRVRVEEELRASVRLFDTIIGACPDIVTILDGTGRVVEVSDAASLILGLDRATPHDQLEQGVHPEDMPATRAAYRRLFTGNEDAIDLRYRARHADGHWVTLESRARPVLGRDGRVRGAVVVSRDVSGDIDAQQELRRAVDRAQHASAAKSQFLSRMSHELRTPLNSVLGFAQLLQMEHLPSQQAEWVEHILRAGLHLRDLIDEVLDIARIETGQLDLVLEPVGLRALVDDAVSLTQPLAERAGVTVDVAVSAAVLGGHILADRQRLLQVLLNLLSNAVKYNRPGGMVTVVADRGTPGTVHITVSDTGPGIAPDLLPRLFDPFDRLGAEHTGVEGTGVGLTLTKHLVEQMGGTIDVVSEVGVGTTFAVALAVSDAPSPASGEGAVRSAPPPAVRALRILYAEDNRANVDLVEQIFARRGGVEMRSARTGAECLAVARAECPDLVLLDLHLPDIDGGLVLQKLRSDPRTAGVPVVVVTADTTPEHRDTLHAAGASAYLTKPIDIRRLLVVVEDIVGGRGR